MIETDQISVEEKERWVQNASNRQLINQLISFYSKNRFGKFDDDIELVETEIFKRMGGE